MRAVLETRRNHSSLIYHMKISEQVEQTLQNRPGPVQNNLIYHICNKLCMSLQEPLSFSRELSDWSSLSAMVIAFERVGTHHVYLLMSQNIMSNSLFSSGTDYTRYVNISGLDDKCSMIVKTGEFSGQGNTLKISLFFKQFPQCSKGGCYSSEWTPAIENDRCHEGFLPVLQWLWDATWQNTFHMDYSS